MRLYIGNVAWDATDKDLAKEFSEFGPVRSARIMLDRETRKSRGFAFVEFERHDDGEEAIKEMDGRQFMGRPLRVNEARPRPENNQGGRRG